MPENRYPYTLAWISPEMFPEPGGIGHQAAYLCKELHHLGFSVSLLAGTSQTSPAMARVFDQTLPFSVERLFFRRPAQFIYLQRIWRFFKIVRQNRIIVCSGKWPLLLGGIFSRMYPRNWVAVVHGSELDLPSRFFRRWMNWSLGGMKKVIAVSEYTADHLPPLKGKKSLQIKVIGNGVDLEEFANVGTNGFTRERLGFPALITVGSVKERKGQQQVIAALPQIKKQFPDARYHVVGLPHDVPKLEKQVRALGLEDSVAFYGVQPREDMQHLLKASDIFLLPSQHTDSGDFEGYGIAILEANALGVPAIASAKSGSKDAIDAESGVLLDDSSPESISRAVASIISNSSRYERGARAFSSSRSWADVALAYKEFILGT